MSNQERIIELKDGRTFTAKQLETEGLINWDVALSIFAKLWGREFSSTRDQIFTNPFPLIRAILLLTDDDELVGSGLPIITELKQAY